MPPIARPLNPPISRSVHELPDRLVNVYVRRSGRNLSFRYDYALPFYRITLRAFDEYSLASSKINCWVYRDVLYTSNTPHFPTLEETKNVGRYEFVEKIINHPYKTQERLSRRGNNLKYFARLVRPFQLVISFRANE